MTNRPSTQGCTEQTCIYHGEANRLKASGLLRENWEPMLTPEGDLTPESETEYDKAVALRDGAYL